jgi:hypothetical protein
MILRPFFQFSEGVLYFTVSEELKQTFDQWENETNVSFLVTVALMKLKLCIDDLQISNLILNL